MSEWKREIRRKMTGLKLEPAREAEIVEELAQHLDDRQAELISRGVSPQEARRLLLAELSASDLLTRGLRQVERPVKAEPAVFGASGSRIFGSWWPDLRYAARMLRKSPGFTLVAIFTLALGIGANTAIFSLVREVLLRPLPFAEPERLIGIRESKVGEGHGNPLAWRSFFAIRDRAQTLEYVAAYLNWNPDIDREDQTVRVLGAQVSRDYFKVLGMQPLLGRDFIPEDEKPGAPPVVILGSDLWQQLYNSDPQIIGKSIRISGTNLTVIGVMPTVGVDGRSVGGEIGWRSIWTAFQVNETKAQDNPGRAVRVNARMRPGITLTQARAELETLMEGLKQSYPLTHSREVGIYAAPLRDYVILPNAQLALWILFGAVACVLLIACANVANLLLVRAAEREKELAVRAALGASRWALVRQLLAESLLLSFGGALAGWLLAQWLLTIVNRYSPDVVRRLGEIKPDAGVLAFTLSLSVLTGLLFGLAPAWTATKIDLNEMLKDGARGLSTSWRRHRLRGVLVVGEIALALILLVGSGLLLKSFANLRGVDLGFNPERLLTMTLRLPNYRYREAPKRVAFFRQTLANIQRLPGVESAGICFSLPMTGDGATDPVIIEGRPPVPKGEEPVLRGGSVSTDYFKTMGIQLHRGRYFTDEEVWEGRPVIIVNELFARRFFPDEDPIGKRIKAGYGDPPYSTIVGVVASHIQPGIDNRIWEEMFYPYVNTADPPLWQMNLVVKTAGEPAAMTSVVINEARRLDGLLPIGKIATMDEMRKRALQSDRFNLWLLGSFAGLALALAALGIYSVIACLTTQRTREIGIRIALGAQTRDVLRLVLKQGMVLGALGTGVGVIGAFILTRLMTSLLFGVGVRDPWTFALIALLLIIVTVLACLIPARRATRVDPLVALRSTE
jgi:putative ABC transport system permease protein